MMQFGSVKGISEARLEELKQVKGISSNLSNEIFNYFKSTKNN